MSGCNIYGRGVVNHAPPPRSHPLSLRHSTVGLDNDVGVFFLHLNLIYMRLL
jgi:hypothetical protein